MQSPREQPPLNPPSTPNADAAAAGQEDKRPPRAQRRAREVSSRYMTAVTSPSVPPSSSSAGGGPSACPALPPPPPPRKAHPKQKHHHHQPLFPPAAGGAAPAFTPAADAERARARRSPSPRMRRPQSPEIGDSDGEGSWFGDENRPEAPPPVSRSSETPIPSTLPAMAAGTQRRRAVRLFREIGGEQQHPPQPPPPPSEHQKPPESFHSRVVESKFLVRKPRPGTPVVHFSERTSTGAITPRPGAEGQTLARSVNARTASRRTTTSQVSRSLQETLSGTGQPPRVPGTPPAPSDRENNSRSVETSPENSTANDFSEAEETCSISSPGGLCDSPPICNQSGRARMSSDCRSSMPEADLLPTMSSRLLTEGNSSQFDGINSSSSSHRGLSSSLCHRSLNSALSSCQQRQLNPSMSIGRLPTSLRTPSNSVRPETVCLLPQPGAGRAGLDSRKGRKISSRQEDAHTLRLVENRYLQWRFANARAQAAVQARRVAAERSLYGVSDKLSELHDSVMRKNIELGHLQSMRTVSTILEAQMPYLGEWATLEGDYSRSLSGAIKSLQDASLRLPIIGNVRADTIELGEALHSATNVLEALAPRVGRLETKADGMQTVLSDLAKVVSEERALIEEFGDLLAEAHKLQVNECSLRIHLIQLKRANPVQIRVES